MNDDRPYTTRPRAERPQPSHIHHDHLSPWAIIIGFTFAIPIIGLITHPVVFVIGALLLAIGVIGWVREDYTEFPKGPNPLTMHTVGKKDNGWWGIMLFLATEVILFGALFATWFFMKQSSIEAGLRWPPIGTTSGVPETLIPLTAVNTAILVGSSFVLHWAEKGLFTGKRKRFLWGMGITLLMGAVFLTIQAYEYAELIGKGFTLDQSIYSSLFYILTGTHGLHVFGGLVFLGIVFIRALKGQFDEKRHTALTAASYYWHFVDVVWVLLFVIVYLQWI
jgi:cytochrome c oxidase subunit III